ncbi:hypothetical protein UA08_08935 [Talaromyces atroroseus]|uniref:Uncharacterized protein n=1 Tax=Talaromyces atroroseus TaxID=1441469 RepID=A0A225AN06_TALAT|nr:hypothetical protein UA08_08935 [Talaromyces atroroseus]OKL55815.1 hypothetical protein UA08_08935 [Talaromyces atroroseus]
MTAERPLLPQIPWRYGSLDHVYGCHGSPDIGQSDIAQYSGIIKVMPGHVQIVEKRPNFYPALLTDINDETPSHDIVVAGISPQAVLLARTTRLTACQKCISDVAFKIMQIMSVSGSFDCADPLVRLYIFVPALEVTAYREVATVPSVEQVMSDLTMAFNQSRGHQWDVYVCQYFPGLNMPLLFDWQLHIGATRTEVDHYDRVNMENDGAARIVIDRDNCVNVQDAARPFRITYNV